MQLDGLDLTAGSLGGQTLFSSPTHCPGCLPALPRWLGGQRVALCLALLASTCPILGLCRVPCPRCSLADLVATRSKGMARAVSLAGGRSAVAVIEGLSLSPSPDTPHETGCSLGRSSQGGTCSSMDIRASRARDRYRLPFAG